MRVKGGAGLTLKETEDAQQNKSKSERHQNGPGDPKGQVSTQWAHRSKGLLLHITDNDGDRLKELSLL